MNASTEINGKQVENLITRFYYKKKQLCFQIILNMGFDRKIPYQEFEDYYNYKRKFNQLQKAKSENQPIQLSAYALQHA